MRSILAASVFLLLPLSACAQDPVQPKADANLFELRFADGSVVRMIMLESSLNVTTRFGKLTVPWSEVRTIKFGLRYPDGVQNQIETAISQLGSPDFKVRDEAQVKLLRFGELAYPLVEKASREGSPEAMRRSRAIIQQLHEKFSEERLLIKPYDTVETGDFPINGRIESIAFKARNPIFGDATTKLTELRSLRSLSATDDSPLAPSGISSTKMLTR